jgi:hypothetical protein
MSSRLMDLKLDRLLKGVVIDRQAVVFTSIESSQALDSTFFNKISELEFDVEGLAQSLDLKGDGLHFHPGVLLTELIQSLYPSS